MIKNALDGRIFEPDELSKINNLITKIDACRIARNDLIHAQYINSLDGTKEIAILIKHKKEIHKEIDHTEIKDLINNMQILKKEIVTTMMLLYSKYENNA